MAKYQTSQSGDEWMPANLDAATELTQHLLKYKFNDYFRPAYFELVNEPHWSVMGEQKFADWHTDLHTAVRNEGLNTLVGGPCSSVGYYYSNNYQDLGNFTQFIDNTQFALDFYSFHVYDYLNWNATEQTYRGRISTGLPILGVIDALAAYTDKTYGKELKMVISEHGGYELGGSQDATTTMLANQYFPGSGFDWEMERRSISNYNMVSSCIANTLVFMDNPHIVQKSVPFILFESANWDPTYYSSLMVPWDFSNTNQWAESQLIHFYEFFQDVSGRRVNMTCEDPDLQHMAFVDGDQLTIVFNNQSDVPQTIDINLANSGASIVSQSIRRLTRQNDFRPSMTSANLPALNNIQLAGREAVVVSIDYDQPIVEEQLLDEVPFYATEVGTAFSGTKSFQVPMDSLQKVEYAFLRVGLNRPAGTDQDMTVKLNGTTLTFPMEDAANRLEESSRGYATTKIVHFDPVLLQNNNVVELGFSDGKNGGVGSVVIRAGMRGLYTSLDASSVSAFGLAVFPNPASQELNIRLSSPRKLEQPLVFSLYNLEGKLVNEMLGDLPTATLEYKNRMNIEGFTPGVYILKVRSGDQSAYSRVVIK
ncbi:MAG: T9SS type A sorting domain-containing protein [Bacteroidota bacterium]